MNRVLYKLSLLCTGIFLSIGNLSGQTNVGGTSLIRGVVTDASDNQPVIGASIVEQDKNGRNVTGVTTDINGNYAIRVKDPSNKIQVSYIGYKTVDVSINGRSVINVEIKPSTADLEQVVISVQRNSSGNTGFLNIADRDLTTSNVSISAKDLEELQAASIDQALQGRLPGVDIAASSGDPGAGMSIRIRGTSSITGSSDPLIVVDGMPYETSVPDDFNFGSADENNYAQLLNIAPADIETITILKDAAATAIWGSRAANGVLLITTKRGSVSVPVINYSFKGTLSNAPSATRMLNGDQYSQLIPEEYMNRNGVPLNTLTVKEFLYDPSDLYYFSNYGHNTDWVKAITQVGLAGEHTLSLQGGGEKARYYSSVGYLDSKGITIGTGLERISARLNLDYTVSSRIRFRTDIAYTHSVTDRNYVNGTSASSGNSSEDGIRSVAYTKMPNMGIYEYDEFGNLTPNYFSPESNIQGAYRRTYNPVAMAELASNKQRGERITPIFNLRYDLLPRRIATDFTVMFDVNNNKANSFLPQIATGRPYTETVVNRAGDSDLDQFRMQTKSNFTYTPDLGEKHDLMTILSLQTDDFRNINQEALTSNTASSLLTDPSVASRTQNNELALKTLNTHSRNFAGLISAQYKYADKYILNVGLRGDANSRFGSDNRFAFFPSISGRWRISGENFMKKIKQVDDLSLRLSYGQSGKQPSKDYLFYTTYSTYPSSYTGISGVYPSSMELSNLRWETVTGKDLGIDLTMFKRRLTLNFDVYENTTKDLFFENLQISAVSGFNDLDLNYGEMDNRGWEIGLNANLRKSKKLNIDFGFNIARNLNIIREVSEYFPSQEGFSDRNGSYKRFLRMDNPFGSFYGYRFKGVYKDKDATIAKGGDGAPILGPNGDPVYMRFNYPATDYVFQQGDAMYEDINHDGNIDSRDVVYLGNSNPKFTGGFGPSVSFNGQLKLSAFFSYRLGYQVINQTDMYTTNMYSYDNQSTAVLRRWRNPGDVTDVPRAVFGAGYNWLGSDRYVEDASFLRFRSATVSYAFSKELAKKLRMKDFRMYITGENLYTWTKYKGQDPEISMSRGVFGVAVDVSRTPPSRRFTLGVSTRF